MNTEHFNTAQMQAYRLITEAHVSLFITGKAGTGKTTFLRQLQQGNDKRYVVLAPTGIAAILAGGETIHSFFGFPLEVMTPTLLGRIGEEKRSLIEDVEAFIIDEISMVRCDIMDAMDRTLRHVLKRSLPFGGKQMIFVGDLYQLEPVVNKQDREVMTDLYGEGSPYFFKAEVFKRMDLPCISFDQVYRQEDNTFVEILNHIRDGQVSSEDLRVLNQRTAAPRPEEKEVITLCSRRDHAERINESRLEALSTKAYTFEASISGEIKADVQFPAPHKLTLKEGCQVMFLRNDSAKRWMNGTIGTVTAIEDGIINVTTAEGSFEVTPVEWEAYKYTYDRSARKVEKKLTGTFIQYPLRLAWAITIHKSQGMTFDRMILDLGRGLFCKGQLYVALSRVRSLEGLYLMQPIQYKNLSVSEEVISFAQRYNDQKQIDAQMSLGTTLHEVLRQHDYDQACQILLQQALQDTKKGNYRHATLLCRQCFDIMVQDQPLFGSIQQVPAIQGSQQSLCALFLLATFSLYAEQYADAIRYANQVLAHRACLDALYIKARALTQLCHYREADRVNVELVNLLDGSFDAKSYYEIACLNVEQLGDPGTDIICQVVRYRSNYLPAIRAARLLMQRQGHRIHMKKDQTNPLVDAFNSAIDTDTFIAQLEETKQKVPDTYQTFIAILSRQKDQASGMY